ncbi:MAG: ribonuclease III [Trueperella sp.]|nr:ribonuclease III [Trueperella sp.]
MAENKLDEFFTKWGITVPAELMGRALSHRSWAYENDAGDNERLEFLGDSILGAIVADAVFNAYREKDEGDLSKIKSATVSERALAELARELGIGELVRLGNGEELSGGRNKDSILADTVEAIIAATYLAYGLDQTLEIVHKHFIPKIKKASEMGPALDWRTAFEELARASGLSAELQYDISAAGPDHARVYTAKVYVDQKYWGTGEASSQKAAKLLACQDAYQRLSARNDRIAQGKNGQQ